MTPKNKTSMDQSKQETPPCTSATAACKPAVVVRTSDDDPDPTPDQQFLNDDWPRFLVIKSRDNKPIVKHNFFVISKAIEGIAGKVVKITPMTKSELILVQIDNRQKAINLLKTIPEI